MLYKYGKHTHTFGGIFILFFIYFGGIFNNIIPLALLGYEMVTMKSHPTHTHRIIINYALNFPIQ